ncbi:MAG: sigma-70 family RNA polymerase sigma factor [Xanthomonadales bacterium]|nr:sigma-70 family RNA polymerase sigma factor [Xanthomonadales bacterium]
MSDGLDFTELLAAWAEGELAARDAMVSLVYNEVRGIARRQLAMHRDATLAPTELAHEALMRVLGQTGEWQSRRHLMNVIALATRQILVDSARRRHAQKRDGGPLTDLDSKADLIAAPVGGDTLQVDEALHALAAVDARAAEVISLTYFAGMEREEIAALMGVSASTIDRALRFGRAWLKDALRERETG